MCYLEKPDISFIVASLERKTPLISILEGLEHELIVTTLIGKAKCRNWGAIHASGDLLIFFDGDTMLSMKDLSFIIDWLHKHPDSCLSAKTTGYVCTRLLGISRKNFFKLRGFNEVFSEPMDEDFGIRLIREGIPLYHLQQHWLKHPDMNDSLFIHKLRRPSERMKFLLYYPREVWATYLRRFGLKRGILKFLARRFLGTKHIQDMPFMLSRNLIFFAFHALTLPFKQRFSSFEWVHYF